MEQESLLKPMVSRNFMCHENQELKESRDKLQNWINNTLDAAFQHAELMLRYITILEFAKHRESDEREPVHKFAQVSKKSIQAMNDHPNACIWQSMCDQVVHTARNKVREKMEKPLDGDIPKPDTMSQDKRYEHNKAAFHAQYQLFQSKAIGSHVMTAAFHVEDLDAEKEEDDSSVISEQCTPVQKRKRKRGKKTTGEEEEEEHSDLEKEVVEEEFIGSPAHSAQK